MKTVLMISPGFPPEMPLFTRGLAAVGARVIGLGDQPLAALPAMTQQALAHHIQVRNLWDEPAVIAEVMNVHRQTRIDQIECLWEAGMYLAARIREALGLPGMTVRETEPYRDKELMKQVLEQARIRMPRHARAHTSAQVREAAQHVGFPLVIKPIAGAGSQDTYRVNTAEELEATLSKMRHVDEVSVEEFVEGADCTFDTICIDGRVEYLNMCFYRPRALESRLNPWISQQTVGIRDLEMPDLAQGRAMGFEVLKVLGFQTGFTHMEWYWKGDGEAVFGEIGARAPGARTVDVMNYTSDIDLFRGWAEAVVHGRFSQRVDRKYNSVAVFKRAIGEGRIQRIEGLARLMAELGQHICAIDLTPIGAPSRAGMRSVIGDGYLMLRHPEFKPLLDMGDRVATELQLYAG
jgi:hypothetical protein